MVLRFCARTIYLTLHSSAGWDVLVLLVYGWRTFYAVHTVTFTTVPFPTPWIRSPYGSAVIRLAFFCRIFPHFTHSTWTGSFVQVTTTLPTFFPAPALYTIYRTLPPGCRVAPRGLPHYYRCVTTAFFGLPSTLHPLPLVPAARRRASRISLPKFLYRPHYLLFCLPTSAVWTDCLPHGLPFFTAYRAHVHATPLRYACRTLTTRVARGLQAPLDYGLLLRHTPRLPHVLPHHWTDGWTRLVLPADGSGSTYGAFAYQLRTLFPATLTFTLPTCSTYVGRTQFYFLPHCLYHPTSSRLHTHLPTTQRLVPVIQFCLLPLSPPYTVRLWLVLPHHHTHCRAYGLDAHCHLLRSHLPHCLVYWLPYLHMPACLCWITRILVRRFVYYLPALPTCCYYLTTRLLHLPPTNRSLHALPAFRCLHGNNTHCRIYTVYTVCRYMLQHYACTVVITPHARHPGSGLRHALRSSFCRGYARFKFTQYLFGLPHTRSACTVLLAFTCHTAAHLTRVRMVAVCAHTHTSLLRPTAAGLRFTALYYTLPCSPFWLRYYLRRFCRALPPLPTPAYTACYGSTAVTATRTCLPSATRCGLPAGTTDYTLQLPHTTPHALDAHTILYYCGYVSWFSSPIYPVLFCVARIRTFTGPAIHCYPHAAHVLPIYHTHCLPCRLTSYLPGPGYCSHPRTWFVILDCTRGFL